MMKRLAVTIWLCLLTLTPPSIGMARQFNTDWPPDPRAIFAENVAVIDSEITPYADNDKRLIYVYNDAVILRWSEFPFSADLTNLARLYYANTQVVLVDSTHPQSQVTSDDTRWALDPTTGDITLPFDNLCGNQHRDELNRDTLNSAWAYYHDPETEQTHLCSIETGYLSLPLPDDIDWLLLGRWSHPVAPSPNGDWLVIKGVSPGGSQGQRIYAYEVATDTLNDLGRIDVDEAGNYFISESSSVRWLTDTQIIVSSRAMPEWSWEELFLGDVTQPGSLIPIIGHMRFSPVYYDDPPRYEVVPGLNRSRVLLEDCVLQVYDLAAQRLSEYALGELCDYGIILPDGDGARLYLAYDPDLKYTTLVRFNPFTGERADLFTGEIESLESVSSNGRYVVLVMDSSGWLDSFPNSYIQWPQVRNAQLVLYDLVEQRIIYQTPTEWSATQRLREFFKLDATNPGRTMHGDFGPLSRLMWLRDDVFWLRRVIREDGRTAAYEDTLIRLDGDHVIEQPIDEIVGVFAERDTLLIQGESRVLLYEVVTGETTPFINGAGYRITQIEVLADDRVSVEIQPLDQLPHLTQLSALYTVTLSGQ